MNNQASPTHTLPQSILLHLLPGILTGAFYFLVRAPLQNSGFPSIFALMLGVVFVIVPFELGFLLYQAKQKTGRFALKEVISYRQAIPVWQYFAWSLLVFVVVGLVFTLLKPLDAFLQQKVFFWVPALDSGLEGGFARSNLIITYAAVLVLGVFAGPLVEELYFRGYLLPRMPGKFAPLLHSFLFAAYHVFTPWMILTRTLGLLPLVYAVRRKNIYVGIIVHILVNSLDAVMGFAYIASLT